MQGALVVHGPLIEQVLLVVHTGSAGSAGPIGPGLTEAEVESTISAQLGPIREDVLRRLGSSTIASHANQGSDEKGHSCASVDTNFAPKMRAADTYIHPSTDN